MTSEEVMDFENQPCFAYLKDSKGKWIKSRLWECVSYPESSNIDEIREFLNSDGYSGWISPLHNADVIKETGEKKKEHYHIYIVSTGAVAPFHMLKLCRKFGCVTPVKKDSLQGSFDYSYHKNEVFEVNGKSRYSFDDIVTFGSFDKSKYNIADTTPCNIAEVIKFIRTSQCTDIRSLTDYMLDNGKLEFLNIVMKNAYFFGQYMKIKK